MMVRKSFFCSEIIESDGAIIDLSDNNKSNNNYENEMMNNYNNSNVHLLSDPSIKKDSVLEDQSGIDLSMFQDLLHLPEFQEMLEKYRDQYQR